MRNLKIAIIVSLLMIAALAPGCSSKGSDSGSLGVAITPGGSSSASALSLSITANPISTSESTTVTATVVDGLGNYVPDGTTVTFFFAPGDEVKARMSSATSQTVNGLASVTVTATSTASAIAVVNATSGAASGSISVSITAGSATGNVLVETSSLTLSVGGQGTITATVRDASGALMNGVTVDFTLDDATRASLNPASGTTNASGVATTTLTGIAQGGVSVTATVQSLSGIYNSAAVTITPASNVPALTITADSASILTNATTTINALLSGFTPVGPGLTVNFSVNNATAATLSAPSALTNASGIAKVVLTSRNIVTPVTVTASYSAQGLTGSTTISIEAPPPDNVTLVANPQAITVFGTTTFTATVQGNGQPVPDGTSVNFVINDTTYGTLSSTIGSTVGGSATTTFVASNKSGSISISAVAGTVSDSETITISPAATGSIQFVSAVPQVIGIAGSGQTETSVITFAVKDINGNPASEGTPVSFTLEGPGGSEYIGADDSTPATATASTVNGSATVILHSGNVAGPVTVIASTEVNSLYQTTLSAAVGLTDTTISASTSGFPATGRIKIDNEMIDYAGTTGTAFSGCTRGVLGTVATNHLAGANVYGQNSISSSATQVSIGGGAPSETHWNLTTSQWNLAGLAFSGKEASISAWIGDRFGNYNILQGTAVNFYAEGGAVDRQGVTDSTGKTTVVLRTQAPQPRDVKNITDGDADFTDFALAGFTADEPFYLGITTAEHPSTNYNPRDGWVKVLSTTMGEEEFIDETGDGMFTRSYSTTNCPPTYTCECDGGVTNGYSGCITGQWNGPSACSTAVSCVAAGFGGKRSEGFKDIGEPFYDVNDNGIRDNGSTTGYPFEQHIDSQNNGVYDEPNGKWDGPDCLTTGCLTSKMIWKDITLVFSGHPYFYPLPDADMNYGINNYHAGEFAVATSNTPPSIMIGDSETFMVIVGDENLNRLEPGTTISATVSSPGEIMTRSSYELPDGISHGPTVFSFTVAVADPGEGSTYPVSSIDVEVFVETPSLLVNETAVSVPLSYPAFSVPTQSLPNGTVGSEYTATLIASGARGIVTWSIDSGTLPTGLSLDPTTGVISGTPTTAAVYPFTVRATDGLARTDTEALSITIL